MHSGFSESLYHPKHIMFIGLLILNCMNTVRAQQVFDRWCFSYNMGIDFTSSGAVFNPGNNIAAPEGCISVCDDTGNLLLYASPTTVWDSAHNVMPNGDSLDGHISAKLGVFSAPVPGSPQRHYVFTNDAVETYPFEMETRYSIVNMTLNGGLGDVESGSKNTLLFDYDPHVSEVITGCAIAGQTEGYWLFLRKANEIHVYKITSAGINSHTSYQANLIIAVSHLIGLPGSGRYFYMDGIKHLDSMPWRGIMLAKFDPVNGTFSDELFIPITNNLSNGAVVFAETSPNERYVYLSHFVFAENNTYVLSLDLETWDQDSIIHSIDTVGVLHNNRLFEFKLGINDTIYINRDLDSNLALATIGNPDQINGPAVFEPAAFPVQLNALSQHGQGLPNKLNYGKPDFEARYTCLGDSTWFVFFGLADSLKWNFNDPNAGMLNFSTLENPYFLFSQPDAFAVELIAYYKNNIDTISHEVIITDTLPDQIFESRDGFLCGTNDSIKFDFSTLNPTMVLWSDSVNTINRSITDTGVFSVVIANECDTLRDTLVVRFATEPSITLTDTTLCEGSQLILEMGDSTGNNLWSTGDTNASIIIDTSLSPDLSPLEIWLTASNACGTVSDTMTVSFLPMPIADLPRDSVHCLEAAFYISHSNTQNVNYWWNDSTSDEQILINTTATVWLIAENECGMDADTFSVNFYPEIKSELGEDTLVCISESVLLDASWPGANFVWSTGNTDDSITVSESDTYIVTISSPPCQKVVSRTVSFTEEACNESGCKFSIPNVFSPNADRSNVPIISSPNI